MGWDDVGNAGSLYRSVGVGWDDVRSVGSLYRIV